MFKHRSIQELLGLCIIILALLISGAVITTQRVTSTAGGYRLAPLDWYLTHDHAGLDGDNDVVRTENVEDRLAPLTWYLAHAHAVLDGDNNVILLASEVSDSRLAPLDWYLSRDHAILDGDNDIVPK